MLNDELGEVVVAEVAGGFLDALTVGGGVGACVEMGHMAFDAVAFRQPADERLVAVTVAGAQVEVAVGYSEGYTDAVEEVGHAYGVAAAADGQEYRLTPTPSP